MRAATIRVFHAVAAIAVLAAVLPAQVGKSQGLLDANSAGEKELLNIPGMTADLVKEVLAKRPFASVTELDAVLASSLNKEQRAAVYRRAFVHINLNAGTKDEILAIPGIGEKMLHEFEEYRPYKALAQFRREIGKYVNKAELARLEQYVFVPIDLNSASDEDILSIPGIGPKMLHEFKEYRPYRSIEQFRREIGKYVSAKEVARFERFVTIGK